MKKNGNILVNVMLVLAMTSVVFIALARSNDHVHKVESVVFEQDVPVTYTDYTLELFDEDVDSYFDFYVDTPGEYNSETFKAVLLGRINGLRGFVYKGDVLTDDLLDSHTQYVRITSKNGYSMSGVDKYIIAIDLPNYKAEYHINVEFEKTWWYTGRNYHVDYVQCHNSGKVSACNRLNDLDNYQIDYTVSDSSNSVLILEEE